MTNPHGNFWTRLARGTRWTWLDERLPRRAPGRPRRDGHGRWRAAIVSTPSKADRRPAWSSTGRTGPCRSTSSGTTGSPGRLALGRPRRPERPPHAGRGRVRPSGARAGPRDRRARSRRGGRTDRPLGSSAKLPDGRRADRPLASAMKRSRCSRPSSMPIVFERLKRELSREDGRDRRDPAQRQGLS